jgi:predicted dehydrogenase
MIGVGIVGCGLIGAKRARAIAGKARLVACTDVDRRRAEALAGAGGLACDDWRRVVEHPEVQAIFVATPHDALAAVTLAAIEAGKHVLVEKPAARSLEDLEPVMAAAARGASCIRVGFNHRYHRAMRKAKELISAGVLGPLMYVRGRYGHGGRVGYEREWRANPELSGGGELIDQGPHLIDLARWFLGREFSRVEGFAHTYFWDMPVDDNAFMLLRTTDDKAAFLHVSCTEWKNLFSMEIYGSTGKLEISGLGGSYGVERLCWYRMLPEMGPPETTCWEFPMADDSWEQETAEFLDDIVLGRQPAAGLPDAYSMLTVVDRIYRRGPP